MKILIYGAGRNGREVLKLLEQYGFAKDVVGFADRQQEGWYCDFPIIKPEEIKKNYKIIIAIENFDVAKEVFSTLKNRELQNIYWFQARQNVLMYEDFFTEQCTSCIHWDKSIMQQVEMHVMDACNLNCRGCTHYSPIFENKVPKFEEKMNDVRILKEKIDTIVRFFILGGEPLLNPELDKYIKEIRNMLPYTELYIVTNGLLIPSLSDATMSLIKKEKVRVIISEYEPTHRKMDEIRKKLDTYKVMYNIRAWDVKQKFNLPLSLNECSKRDRICISNGCTIIGDGKIARCPQLLYVQQLNKYFDIHLPSDGLMELESCPSGDDLITVLKRETDLCKHCIRHEIHWSVCGKKPNLQDFVIKND